MNKNIYPVLFVLLLVLSACSNNQSVKPDIEIPVYRKPVSEPNQHSIFYYTLAETAVIENDLFLAREYFLLADNLDPTNIHIKERIIETLYILSRSDTRFIGEITALGYIEAGFVSPLILRFTADALFSQSRNDEAIELMKQLVLIEPAPANYYSLFYFQAVYANKVELIYLEKALAKAWTDPELLVSIAMLYEYHNPLRAKEIFEKNYSLNKDDNSFFQLLEFYLRRGDKENFSETFRKGIKAGREFEQRHLTIFLESLFEQEKYGEVIEFYPLLQGTEALGTVLLAAYMRQDISLAEEVGQMIIASTEDKRKAVYALLGELNIADGNYPKAAQYLVSLGEESSFIDDMVRMMFRVEDDGNEINRELLAEELSKQGLKKELAYLLLSRYYLAIGDAEKATDYLLSAISVSYSSEEDMDFGSELWKSVAVLFLDRKDEEKARQTLTRVKEDDFNADNFIGTFYYSTKQDSLAEESLLRYINSAKKPEAESILLLAAIYERNKRHQDELSLVKRGVELYPDDPMLLNWLGYTLVIHTDRYEEAEGYLLKAFRLDSEAYHIQDSIGWLYYKKGDYEKAMHYFDMIIKTGVADSIVAYHIGMVQTGLLDYTTARKYFRLTVELNTDEESVIKAQKILKEIENK